MEIEKKYGTWNLKNASEVEDLAYYFYSYKRRHRIRYNITSQQSMVVMKDNYISYFDKARTFIRDEKIKKLRKRLETK